MESMSLPEFKGFDWDDGNVNNNWELHKASPHKAEQVFFNRPLFVAFTLRGVLVRVISARDMSRGERKVYQG